MARSLPPSTSHMKVPTKSMDRAILRWYTEPEEALGVRTEVIPIVVSVKNPPVIVMVATMKMMAAAVVAAAVKAVVVTAVVATVTRMNVTPSARFQISRSSNVYYL